MSSSILPKATNGDVIMVEKEDFLRLEGKVNDIATALNKLVVVEERQLTQGERIGRLEAELAAEKERHQATREELNRWINRGIGVWVAVVAVVAGFKFWAQFVK